MQFRHEWKHIINHTDYLILRQRLRAVLAPDPHAGPDGGYLIRSVYFDTPDDKALKEKISGVDRREKFRIRCYNSDPSFIHLEKKIKLHGLCNKQATRLTAKQTRAVLDGDIDWLAASNDKLLLEFYSKLKGQLLSPKTMVEYTREPFVYPPGNVRVTLDYGLRSSLRCTDFLNPDCPTIAAGDASYLLEIKYDRFLPALVVDLVQLGSRRSEAFSKYAACRIYG